MTSALKNVGAAMYDVSKRVADNEDIGGTTTWLGIAEGACGIPPYEGSTAQLVDKQVYDDTIAVEARIKTGELVVPMNQGEFDTFVAGL
jgi:basic membrane protein A